MKGDGHSYHGHQLRMRMNSVRYFQTCEKTFLLSLYYQLSSLEKLILHYGFQQNHYRNAEVAGPASELESVVVQLSFTRQ